MVEFFNKRFSDFTVPSDFGRLNLLSDASYFFERFRTVCNTSCADGPAITRLGYCKNLVSKHGNKTFFFKQTRMNFFSSIDGPQVLQIMIHDCEAGNDVIFRVDILVNDEPARIKSL